MLNRLLGFAGSAIVGVFLPIFLYEFFDFSLTFVLLWYAVNFAVKLPFFVPGAKIFDKIGLNASMVIGTMGLVLFYATFSLLSAQVTDAFWVSMALGAGGLMLASVFYWSPFHIDLAELTSKGKRGKQIGAFYAAQRLIGVLAPIGAGWFIMNYGHEINFIIALGFMLVSVIPLVSLPEIKTTYEFGFVETFKKVFSKKYRSMSFSMMSYGAENLIGVVVWPIFLFEVFKGDYLNIGTFAAIIVVIGFVLELAVGKETDKVSASKLLKIGTGVYALGWVVKGIVQTVVGVFAASTFHSFGSIMLRTPMDALMYEQAADSGHYVDEYTIIREIALTIGRTAIMLLLIIVTSVFSLSVSFFVAALLSLGITQLANYHASKLDA